MAAWQELFHHVSQVACGQNFARALHDADFHLQQLAAHAGPGQAVHQAHLGLQFQLLGMILHDAQQGFQIVAVDTDPLVLSTGDRHSRFPTKRCQLPFQLTHTGLLGVTHNQLPQGAIGNPELSAGQAMALHLPGQQVPAGNLQLLLIGVTGHLDDLHTVRTEAEARYPGYCRW